MGKVLVVCLVLFMGLVALSSHKDHGRPKYAAQQPVSIPKPLTTAASGGTLDQAKHGDAAIRCDDLAACQKANAEAYRRTAENRKREMEASEQTAIIAVTKGSVAASLRDPASALFREVFYARKKKGDAVCGEVNATNGFGGYTGFQPFVVTLPEGTLYLNSIPKWNSRCAS